MILTTQDTATLQAAIWFFSAWLADISGDRDAARRGLRQALRFAPGAA